MMPAVDVGKAVLTYTENKERCGKRIQAKYQPTARNHLSRGNQLTKWPKRDE